jgi:Rieske Fe-S protein
MTDRRAVLTAGIGLGVGVALAPGMALAQATPATIRPKAGDLLVRDGDASSTPLGPQDIKPDSEQVFAWAMDPEDKTVRKGTRLNGLILVRLDPSTMTPQTKARAADGVVAYTAICTHNGCDVTDWIAAEKVVQCGCHFTKYDPRDSARIIEGPAPRPLPALPLKVEGGKLVVAGPFTDRIGFEVA